jgi:hypothetical protein
MNSLEIKKDEDKREINIKIDKKMKSRYRLKSLGVNFNMDANHPDLQIID